MGMCKGNRGNLMQHWTLCECLARLQNHYSSLHFVTTHSMAPWAIPYPPKHEDLDVNCTTVMQNHEELTHSAERSSFLAVGRRLANLAAPTVYEAAWKRLSTEDGLPYPSSALLVAEIWKKSLSLALCEYDTHTANEIDGWLRSPRMRERLHQSVLLRGDWRCLACSPLVLTSSQECLYLEMDPMRYDSRRKWSDASPDGRKNCDPQSLYPEDIERLVTLLDEIERPIVLQISSFSTQNANSITRKRDSLSGILRPGGFNLLYETSVGGQMVSFVFHRNTALPQTDFRLAFSNWLGGIE